MFDLKVTHTSSAAKVNEALKTLAKKQVYVGVPQQNASRKDGTVNNAELMYIHTNGSPMRNIPARPVIEPAIEADNNKKVITEQLRDAAEAALDGDAEGMNASLQKAGIAGSNAAKRWFTDSRNGWPKNKPSTIRNKIRKLRGTSYQDAMDILDSGGDISSIDTPLIDTGELRRSITYVVGEDK
jgi:hypothetical protein